MLLKRLWLAVLVLNFVGVIFFWLQPEANLATRFDFHGNPTSYQNGREFAATIALILFLFNGLSFFVYSLASKAGFAELTNLPNKAYWLQNGMLESKLKELLKIQALWINVLILAILGYTLEANHQNPDSLQLHPSFLYFLVAMATTLGTSIFIRTRKKI